MFCFAGTRTHSIPIPPPTPLFSLSKTTTPQLLINFQYNADETTTSLVYAARVKLIKNDAKKESGDEAVAHLKKIIHEFETEGRSKTLEAEGKGDQ